MAEYHRGLQTIVFEHPPTIVSTSAIGGKKESEGPLAKTFDTTDTDTMFGEKTWEKAESKMQMMALDKALLKARLQPKDVDVLFGGDLLNQCISTTFSIRDTNIPFIGLYGACSTMAESLLLSAMTINAKYADVALAMTSSHFAAAERQYRFPLPYGGQRTPTCQWTVTGAGCAVLSSHGIGPKITSCTIGRIVDWGIKDANNMGAAMAPAAYDTISQHLKDIHAKPQDYDLIVTGDLGNIGKAIVTDLFAKDGVDISKVYDDCGSLIFDPQTQDVHAGGSGCGCSAVVLCGHLLRAMEQGKYQRILFAGTGALLSPTSTQQGESIPGICHAVSIERGR